MSRKSKFSQRGSKKTSQSAICQRGGNLRAQRQKNDPAEEEGTTKKKLLISGKSYRRTSPDKLGLGKICKKIMLAMWGERGDVWVFGKARGVC